MVDHDRRARLAGARSPALGVQGEAVAGVEREVRAIDAGGAGRVRRIGDAQAGVGPVQPASRAAMTRPATGPGRIRMAPRMRIRAARGHRCSQDRWADLAQRGPRSALAAAACHVIDEITMWYLGSVPHQPDVQADVALVVADVTD